VGTSTNAILAYGYNLGGPEEGWAVREADGDGLLRTDWYDEDNDDDDGADFVAAAEKRLLTAVGFTETDYKAPGYSDRRKIAEAQIGVVFDAYCHIDFPLYIMATNVITVRRGNMEYLDLHALAGEPAHHNWDEQLTVALRILGITPIQPQPDWLLCSYWG